MLSYILNGKQKFEVYLLIVGIAYIGYFTISLLTLIINYFYIPQGIDPESFGTLIQNFKIVSIIGKSGEYWVLTIVAIGIARIEKFDPIKSILISFLPNFGLLFFKELYSLF